ncbi:MAG: hypothetical protein H6733_04970 [Alphaproteobacteria bacterium]|nr:hypothetical protein [Alphaproteobacteria bacterium]
MSIVLEPAYFYRDDPETDFAWRITQPADADALFLFNDNVGAYDQFHAGDRSGGCAAGGGNATIRPYQCATPPRAAGMPTGPGWDTLTDAVRATIDAAAAYAAGVARAQGYRRLIYSATPGDPGRIGTSIFHVGDDVRRYAVTALARALGTSVPHAAAAAAGGAVPTPQPQPVTVGGHAYTLVAFYYPGSDTPWDTVYQAPFLGNFWVAPVTLTVGGVTATFHCAEAAFQSTKWWHDATVRKAFEACPDGSAAFHYKKTLTGADPSYAGLGRDGAMDAVLAAKFTDPALAAGLLATGAAYLLEHNAKAGLDHHWSDDHDGTGENALGLALMARRSALGGAGVPVGASDVGAFTAQVKTST